MKAADIPDIDVLMAVLAIQELDDMWTSRWALNERLPGGPFPEKVVLAKARKMIRRKLIRGCGCGCRGDFELMSDGMSALFVAGISSGRIKRYSEKRAIPWVSDSEEGGT